MGYLSPSADLLSKSFSVRQNGAKRIVGRSNGGSRVTVDLLLDVREDATKLN